MNISKCNILISGLIQASSLMYFPLCNLPTAPRVHCVTVLQITVFIVKWSVWQNTWKHSGTWRWYVFLRSIKHVNVNNKQRSFQCVWSAEVPVLRRVNPAVRDWSVRDRRLFSQIRVLGCASTAEVPVLRRINPAVFVIGGDWWFSSSAWTFLLIVVRPSPCEGEASCCQT